MQNAKETGETSGHFTVEEIQEGMLAAVWQVPVRGFAWRGDVFAPERPRDLGPWLVPIEAESESEPMWSRYPLLRSKTLLDDFIGLADAFRSSGFKTGRGAPPPESDSSAEKRVLRFANKYGMLESGSLLQLKGGGAAVVGESLSKWRSHVSAAATWLWLYDRAERGDAVRLAEYVVWQTNPRGVGIRVASRRGRPDPELARMIHVSAGDSAVAAAMPPNAFVDFGMLASAAEDPEDILSMLNTGDILAPIQLYVTQRVNQMLSRRIRRVILFPDRSVRYFPSSLWASVLVRLQDRLTGSELGERVCAYRDCPRLGGRFTPNRRDQQFCSKNCRQLAIYHRRKDKEAHDD